MHAKTLKGSHVLAIALAFLAVILAANAVFITLAIKTFPGQVVDKPYEQGLRFNEQIAAKSRQAALGWTADIDRATIVNGDAEIEIRFASSSGDPLHGLAIEGQLRRPAAKGEDKALVFESGSSGAYIAKVGGVEMGAWDLTVTATAQTGETFALKKRLILE